MKKPDIDRRKGAKRTKGAVVILSGIVAGVALVGVALAVVLIQVSATVSSNEFLPTTTTTTSTTTTIPPASNGLLASLGSGGTTGACGSFGSGSLALGAVNFDLNGSGGSTGQFVCVHNQSGFGQITSVDLALATSSSGEDGCSAAEGTVDPEGITCGSAGELADLLSFTLQKTDQSGTPSCSGSVSVAPGGSTQLTGSMFPNDTCVYAISVGFNGSPTDDQKLAASTDIAGFTFDLTATP
jgi:hypothetical protein